MIKSNDDTSSPVKKLVNNFLRTSTLHGFKYLCSKYYNDRVGWVISSCASTICATWLFVVLWARFMQVPALLELVDERINPDVTLFWPQVAVCPPVMLTNFFMTVQPGMNHSMSHRLSRTLSHVITGKSAAPDQLVILEKFFGDHNISLNEMLIANTPACHDLVVACRWHNSMVPCQYLFEKELTTTNGVCCVFKPERAYKRVLNESFRPISYIEQTRKLDVLLQCSKISMAGCQFFTKYNRETNVQAVTLAPSNVYVAQLLFTSVPMSSADDLVQSMCIEDMDYSKEVCMENCAEQYCGCQDPVHLTLHENKNANLPPCTITKLACLRNFEEFKDNSSCTCLPSCEKVSSDLNLDFMPLNTNTFTVDPLYVKMNSMSTVLHIRLNIALSRMFQLNPSETWVTLLSSLGGVFNMFLGVGLFSALEVLFLLLIKLPNALIKSKHNKY